MSKSTFIFCDSCNPKRIRAEINGFVQSRRTSDGCSWYEYREHEDLKIGWIVTSDGENLCPKCQKKEQPPITKTSNDKIEPSKQLVRLVRKNRPCGYYVAKPTHYSAA